MPKLTRGLVLGAMLAVLSTTAAVAQEPPVPGEHPVTRFRAGKLVSLDHPATMDQAVQQFRAGERASLDQPVPAQTREQVLAQQRRWYYASTRPPAQPAAEPSAQPGQPVGLLVLLGAAAVLALSLDAMVERRKTRKATAHHAT